MRAQRIHKLVLAVSMLLSMWGATRNVQAAIYFIHPDHLGTPRAVTSQAGTVVWRAHHEPFGKAVPTTHAIAMNLRFPGQYFDSETGLHYNYYRDYDPETGRYLQSDPIGLDGGINTYAYVESNPLRYIDPTGENPAAIPVVAIACLTDPVCVGAVGISLNCLVNPSACEDALGSVCDAASAASDAVEDLLKPYLSQDKKLTPGEIKKLKGKGIDPEELKGGKSTGARDLFKDKKGNVVVKPKDGSGPGDPTGININDP